MKKVKISCRLNFLQIYSLFQDKTLVSCPKENISKVNITDDLISLMVFKEFNKASSKNKVCNGIYLFGSNRFIYIYLLLHIEIDN